MLLAILFTFADMMNQRCKDYCLYVENELGAYFESSDSCYCGHLISNETLGERKLLLPSKPIRTKSVPTVPYIDSSDSPVKFSWED